MIIVPQMVAADIGLWVGSRMLAYPDLRGQQCRLNIYFLNQEINVVKM